MSADRVCVCVSVCALVFTSIEIRLPQTAVSFIIIALQRLTPTDVWRPCFSITMPQTTSFSSSYPSVFLRHFISWEIVVDRSRTVVYATITTRLIVETFPLTTLRVALVVHIHSPTHFLPPVIHFMSISAVCLQAHNDTKWPSACLRPLPNCSGVHLDPFQRYYYQL